MTLALDQEIQNAPPQRKARTQREVHGHDVAHHAASPASQTACLHATSHRLAASPHRTSTMRIPAATRSPRRWRVCSHSNRSHPQRGCGGAGAKPPRNGSKLLCRGETKTSRNAQISGVNALLQIPPPCLRPFRTDSPSRSIVPCTGYVRPSNPGFVKRNARPASSRSRVKDVFPGD